MNIYKDRSVRTKWDLSQEWRASSTFQNHSKGQSYINKKLISCCQGLGFCLAWRRGWLKRSLEFLVAMKLTYFAGCGRYIWLYIYLSKVIHLYTKTVTVVACKLYLSESVFKKVVTLHSSKVSKQYIYFHKDLLGVCCASDTIWGLLSRYTSFFQFLFNKHELCVARWYFPVNIFTDIKYYLKVSIKEYYLRKLFPLFLLFWIFLLFMTNV